MRIYTLLQLNKVFILALAVSQSYKPLNESQYDTNRRFKHSVIFGLTTG